ncbi:MAG: hypothetical protein ACTSU2_15760 [Promethearchaeota archaeon]
MPKLTGYKFNKKEFNNNEYFHESFHGSHSINIVPLASESFGVRSFCIYLETDDLKILLDPGCALGPKREGRAPHPLEFFEQRRLTKKIIEYAKKADYIFISHFHHDHFKPDLEDNYCIYSTHQIFKELYSGKRIFIKNYQEKINANQKKRAIKFVKDIEELNEEMNSIDGPLKRADIIELGNLEQIEQMEQIEQITPQNFFKDCPVEYEHIINVMDGSHINNIFKVNETYLIFPDEFLHGFRNSMKIYVQPMILLKDNSAFYFFPDVEGFPEESQFQNLIALKNLSNAKIKETIDMENEVPIHIIAFGGPATTFTKASKTEQGIKIYENSLLHSQKVIAEFDFIYIDHHIFRDKDHLSYWNMFSSTAEMYHKKVSPFNPRLFIEDENITYKIVENPIEDIKGLRFTDDFRSKHDKFIPLECFRYELYRLIPPSKDYYDWTNEQEKIDKLKKSAKKDQNRNKNQKEKSAERFKVITEPERFKDFILH